MISFKHGDLLEASEQYIVHQCNCISVTPHGLSSSIFDKFKYANCYSTRKREGRKNLAINEDISTPGTIQVCGNGSDKRYVINLFAQYGMGKPYTFNNSDKLTLDGREERKKWFSECLNEICNLKPLSVAFPFKIGCGLAGGSWSEYYKLIESWSDKNKIKVSIYKLN